MKTAQIFRTHKIEAVQLGYTTPDSRAGLAWDNFVASSTTSGFRQSLRWAQLQAQNGSRVIHIGLFNNRRLIGGAIGYLSGNQLADGHGEDVIVMPEGPVLDWLDSELASDCLSHIIAFMEEKATKFGASGLRIAPRVTSHAVPLLSQFDTVSGSTLPAHTICLDLRNPVKHTLREASSSDKYFLHLARKTNFKVECFHGSSGLPRFYELLTAAEKNDASRIAGLAYLTRICDTLCPAGMAKIYIASQGTSDLVGALVIKFGDRETVLVDAIGQLELGDAAGYRLIMQIVEDARADRRNVVDLNGSGFGLSRLARHLPEARRLRLIGTWQRKLCSAKPDVFLPAPPINFVQPSSSSPLISPPSL